MESNQPRGYANRDIGIMLLTSIDPHVMRWLLAGLVLLVLAILASGWRYHGRAGLPEAARSRAELEQALDTECLSIAAPFGEATEPFRYIVERCGFRVGLTIEPTRGFFSGSVITIGISA